MARLVWNNTGERYYELGLDQGVLYVGTQPGAAWSGLISVDETSTGGEPKPIYQDGEKISNIVSSVEFAAKITAFTFPNAFLECDGIAQPNAGLLITGQPRTKFGLSYRTLIGNDTLGTNKGYKLHIVYGATASQSNQKASTIADTTTPNTFEWDITTMPPSFPGYKRTAHIIVDSTKLLASKLTAVENILYGTASTPARIPSPAELVAITT